MTNFNRIQEINNQCMRNIEMIMQESKSIIKNFKIQQAEVMKNIMVTTDESASLEQQFRNFQNELMQREQDQYNQINGRIANEIDNMKRLILQEMSTPSVSINTPTPMPSYNAPSSSMNSSMDLNSFSAPLNNINNNANTTSMDNSAISQPVMNTNNSMQDSNSSMMSEFDNFTNSMQQPSVNNAQDLSQGMGGTSAGANDIPVETKELDEWISEIKNLI